MTKHRRPVVRVSPFHEEQAKLVGSCVGQLRFLADIGGIGAPFREDVESAL